DELAQLCVRLAVANLDAWIQPARPNASTLRARSGPDREWCSFMGILATRRGSQSKGEHAHPVPERVVLKLVTEQSASSSLNWCREPNNLMPATGRLVELLANR